jgi:hypothetical protein
VIAKLEKFNGVGNVSNRERRRNRNMDVEKDPANYEVFLWLVTNGSRRRDFG